MSQLAQLEKKIEQLETRIAFQDQTIEELNQTITSQWSEFDRLRREISRLGEQLADLSPPDQSTGEPPPHY
ncbi:MAG TPA: SlyX family protein [Devosia sp.]|nr:SlyX family protein [Devosia sp.]